ncbi:MAG: epimerase [Cytophagales bacterium CG18_big_fil_WC_8_21_14_2_50_42_9]|nr:MAG: epimerase [Cytophagales bacterium CG18_big_fil_WC_8_21_14_2_50_42_9]
MNLKVIITGATGMVGEGVLHECLLDSDITEVLIINRRPGGVNHPKLKEVIHQDFLNFADIAIDFASYQACFFCLGISSMGISTAEYYRLTYDLTLHVAKTMAAQNSEMVFCYVSGSGTDTSEKGLLNWARVKGKTENDLMQLPFKKAYMFRPGFLSPTPGLKNTKSYYKYFDWLEPGLKIFFSPFISTLRELGLAMINAVKQGYTKQVLKVADIKILAKA